MKKAMTAHQYALRRSICPQAARPIDGGHPKRLLRQIRRDYVQTHHLMSTLAMLGLEPLNLDAAFVLQVAANVAHAEALFLAACALPSTRVRVRVLAAAEDNLDVAREVVDVLAHCANRAAVLN